MNAFSPVKLDDPRPGTDAGARLLARAQHLAASGRPEAARPLLAAVRRLGTDPDAVDMLEARLLLRAGQTKAVLSLLDRALARPDAYAGLRLMRAEARLIADDPAGAATDAADAVIAQPANPAAKAALGIALAELGQLDDAQACLAEARRGDPANPTFSLALARAQEVAGWPDQAAATLDDGIAQAPASLRLRNAAVRLAIGEGAFVRAIELAEASRRAGLLDACMLGMLGHAKSCLGQHGQASEAYSEALKLAPEDAYVRHLVAANGQLPAPAQAADDYVRVVFEGYAPRFEQHLIALGYRVPGLLREALVAHVAMTTDAHIGPVLDLGCGTGFAAVAMSDLPLGPWHGVDLSPGMLRRARVKGLYERLDEASLPAWLLQSGPLYALAIAADMLCYIGDLEPILAALHDRLQPGGVFVASLETSPSARGWQLGPAGRYAHDVDYVSHIAAACGFEILAAESQALRMEDALPVEGLILTLAKPVT